MVGELVILLPSAYQARPACLHAAVACRSQHCLQQQLAGQHCLQRCLHAPAAAQLAAAQLAAQLARPTLLALQGGQLRVTHEEREVIADLAPRNAKSSCFATFYSGGIRGRTAPADSASVLLPAAQPPRCPEPSSGACPTPFHLLRRLPGCHCAHRRRPHRAAVLRAGAHNGAGAWQAAARCAGPSVHCWGRCCCMRACSTEPRSPHAPLGCRQD